MGREGTGKEKRQGKKKQGNRSLFFRRARRKKDCSDGQKGQTKDRATEEEELGKKEWQNGATLGGASQEQRGEKETRTGGRDVSRA
mmetsp:Transcript_42820/g.101631  ORF Transcript_42820/g.101631 Transcript_42820/m.101631 type:complete len:86 (-) Transcript_42820:231-488(-)